MSLGVRLKELLDEKGITAYTLSAETRISEGSLSKILNGHTKKLRAENATKLSQYFRVNGVWLITGKGEKHIAIEQTVDPETVSVSREAWEVIRQQADAMQTLARSNERAVETNSKLVDTNKEVRDDNKVWMTKMLDVLARLENKLNKTVDGGDVSTATPYAVAK